MQYNAKIQVNNLSYLVDKTTGYVGFWDKLQKGEWEKSTLDIFDLFLDSEHSYIDIGAWIGPTVLYGANRAKHVYAFEPDPIAFRGLQKNINLNPKLKSKITSVNACIANRSGTFQLGSNTSRVGGDTMSSLLFSEPIASWEVTGITLDEYIRDHQINDCNFIKIDIEGAEKLVVPHSAEYLKKNKPSLHLSMHPPFFDKPQENVTEILEALSCYKYIYNSDKELLDPKVLLEAANLAKFYEIIVTDREIN